MKLIRFAALAAALSLAAYTSFPTGTATTDPADPSFDGGGWTGSGTYLDDGLFDGGTSVPADTTNRGGNMIGSGN